jgi:NADH-quinone oxidoreductase subunit J
MEMVGFIILSLLALGSGLMVILRRHPVESALALAVNLVSIAGFYLLLDAQFIALLQVIVYAGAIMVLIIFVVMLLNESPDEVKRGPGLVQRPLGLLLGAAFLWILIRVALSLRGGGAFAPPHEGFGEVATLGKTLFQNYFYPFEAISLLLIVAMVGAVLLAKRRL